MSLQALNSVLRGWGAPAPIARAAQTQLERVQDSFNQVVEVLKTANLHNEAEALDRFKTKNPLAQPGEILQAILEVIRGLPAELSHCKVQEIFTPLEKHLELFPAGDLVVFEGIPEEGLLGEKLRFLASTLYYSHELSHQSEGRHCIDIQGSYEVKRELLRWLQNPTQLHVSVPEKFLILLLTADYCDCKALIAQYVEALSKRLNQENIVDILDVARVINSKVLVVKALHFLQTHRKNLLKDEKLLYQLTALAAKCPMGCLKYIIDPANFPGCQVSYDSPEGRISVSFQPECLVTDDQVDRLIVLCSNSTRNDAKITKSLSIDHCTISAKQVTRICSQLPIEDLSFNCNFKLDAGTAEALSLQNCITQLGWIVPERAQYADFIPQTTSLQTLNLVFFARSCDVFDLNSYVERNPALKRVLLIEPLLKPGFEAFKKHQSLTHLMIRNSPLTPEVIESLLRALEENTSLIELQLNNCKIYDESAVHFERLLRRNQTLKKVDLKDHLEHTRKGDNRNMMSQAMEQRLKAFAAQQQHKLILPSIT